MQYFMELRDWLNKLAPRERRIVVLGAVFVALASLYAFVVDPIYVSHRTLQQRVAEKQQLLEWMRQSAVLLEERRSTLPALPSGGSLLANIDAAARSAALESAVRRIEQDTATRVRVSLEAAEFENVVRWLAALQQTYGVKPVQARLDRTDTPGRVDATFTLASSS